MSLKQGQDQIPDKIYIDQSAVYGWTQVRSIFKWIDKQSKT